ncbi:MAG: sensor histidine kinase, partial [Flavobacteriales bacterium]
MIAPKSPNGIAILSALSITIFLILVYVIFVFIADISFQFIYSFPAFILVFLSVYIGFYFIVRRFIYDKIRLIYKNIRSQKLNNPDTGHIDMNKDVFNKVNAEVTNWAKNKAKEIQELKEQEEFRRQFIGNLAHEIKTPIFSIQGYILTLQEGAIDNPDINKKFLERASKGVDRVTRIIEDLDTITQLESGQLQLEKENFDIVGLVEDIMETLEMRAKKKE